MDQKKTPGRPRIYETASGKVDAFRKRQESAGYLRKEILVTSETWDRVKQLAQEHGVGTADAASGLLEFGLETFDTKSVPKSFNGDWATFGAVASLAGAEDAPTVFAANAFASSAPIGSQTRSLRSASFLAPRIGAAASASAEDKLGAGDNPITQFFLKRKDQNNG
jgi:hypothetical protein